MRGCCVKNDERRVERSSGRNDGHAGRLIRKLALVFLAFAVVAVVLNCALAYVSTRDTFLQSEAYRLGQVGGYAANATPQALPSDALQAWKDNADELDPATTYDQSLAETQGLISAYNAEVDRLKGRIRIVSTACWRSTSEKAYPSRSIPWTRCSTGCALRSACRGLR